MSYDVIVVGARCAGATLATLLAKSGVKTLVLEADALPSGMEMSTHFIQPPGMDVLDEIGVGPAIRACTPPTRRGRFQVDSIALYPHFTEGRAAYCTRRTTVDPMLQNAATAAGAELRDRQRVVDLVRDGERVAGVVVENERGRETIRAKLVVGADGRKSTIARLTGVEEYLTFPMTRGVYYFYFPTPALWHEDPLYRDWDAYIAWEGDGLRYVFQCDGDVLIMVIAPPLEEARSFGQAYREKTVEYLKRSEVTRPLVEATEPIGKGVGFLKANFFYRRPVGPGFALVGDAGNFKDYVTGHGMTDAFIGARRLHSAILAGNESAFERFWRERDVESMPLYFDAIRLGAVGFNDPFTRLLFEYCRGDQELAQRFVRIADRRLSPFTAFSTAELAKVVLSGVLRGRFDVLKPFLATGRQMSGFVEEWERRRALLEALEASPIAAQ